MKFQDTLRIYMCALQAVLYCYRRKSTPVKRHRPQSLSEGQKLFFPSTEGNPGPGAQNSLDLGFLARISLG